MPKYRCKACAHELEGKAPPFACPQCKAKGKGFVDISGEVSAAAAATPAAPAPLATTAVPPLRTAPAALANSTAAPSSAPAASPPPRTAEPIAAPAPPAAPPVPVVVKPRESERIVWRYALPQASGERGRPVRGCPAVDAGGNLFIAINNCLLMFAPDATTPTWEYATSGAIPRSPILGPDGHVRVHSSDGFLHVIDVAGRPVFAPVKVGNALGWAVPVVDARSDTWICLSDGGLQRVDARGATTSRPYFRTRRRFDSTGLIVGDDLVVGCEDNHLYAVPLTASTGANRWADGPELGRCGCPINGAVALGPGPTLLVAGQDDVLHAFGLDGTLRWSVPLPGQALGSPIVDERGNVYLGLAQNPRNQTPRGLLIAVDASTHQIKWRVPTDAPIESTPVLGDDGTLYFGDNDGRIHAVDAQGRKSWDGYVGAAVRSAGVIFGDGRLAFGLDDGSLVVLQVDSRRLAARGWPKLHGPNS